MTSRTHAWLTDQDWSQDDAFDNRAIAEAQIKDLTGFTHRDDVGQSGLGWTQRAGYVAANAPVSAA